MSRSTRVGSAMLALALAGGAATSLLAQIPGMPLFTNPRFATGIRIHADYGKPTSTPAGQGDQSVIQGGLGLVLGPIGLDVNVGTTKATATAAQGCIASPTLSCAGSKATVSALAQLHLWGGGPSALRLSAFGGASIDLDTADVNCTGAGCTPGLNNKQVNIPVGVAIGYHVPLAIASINLWAAPRMNLTRYVNCTGTCPTHPKNSFGWAVGADIPVFRILSVRASYDSHMLKDAAGVSHTFNVWGVGASIGIGGMR